MTFFPKNIVCCYLYPITKYGYPPPAKDTLSHLEEMRSMGFQSVELEGIRSRHLQQVYELRFDIKKKLEETGLLVPYFCVVLPELSSPNAGVRKSNLALFAKGCEIARLLGAEGVVDNAPLPPYQFPGDIPIVRHYEEESLKMASFPEELIWEKYWQELVATYQATCDIAADFGLSYQLHPAMGVLAANPDGFLYFAQAVDRPNLRFNFDTANLFVLKENLSLALIRLAGYIDYIHISDNRGSKTEHLEPGKGNIPWESFFPTLERIGFKGRFGIDIGGSESEVGDPEEAYVNTARWLAERSKSAFGSY